jgi:hypothetical protein
MKQYQYSAALVASVLALGAYSHDARADVITYTQNSADFVDLSLVTSNNPDPVAITGIVYAPNGNSVGALGTVAGSISGTYRSPWENAATPGSGATGWNLLQYSSVQANSSATYNFTATTVISLLWGSPDYFNTIAFYSGPGGTGYLGSLSATALNPPTGIGDVVGSVPLLIQTVGHDLLTFKDVGGTIQSVVISTGNNAFEFADLLPTPNTQLDTPIPAAFPLFATGLGVMGLLARRRKRKIAAA